MVATIHYYIIRRHASRISPVYHSLQSLTFNRDEEVCLTDLPRTPQVSRVNTRLPAEITFVDVFTATEVTIWEYYEHD